MNTKCSWSGELPPYLTFRSTSVDLLPTVGTVLAERGTLTIRGVTRPVLFEVEVTPIVEDWSRGLRAGATGTGTLNRKECGLTWNQVLELGTLLVGERCASPWTSRL